MVMMVLGDFFVTRPAIAEIVTLQDIRLFPKTYGAIDGGDGDLRIDLGCAAVQQLHVGMIVAFRQHAGDHPPLFGDAEAPFGA